MLTVESQNWIEETVCGDTGTVMAQLRSDV
jgi:hypothetical protein